MTLKTIFNHDALLRYLLYAALLLVVLIGMKEASYLFNMIFTRIRVFCNELALQIRWPNYWSFSISPSNEYS